MERITMRKIRDVLRLRYELKLSHRQIANSCQISREAVRNYLRRAQSSKLNWPLPEEMNDAVLESRLFPEEKKGTRKGLPDLSLINLELKKKGVTLELLWQEYKIGTPEGVQYSRFCELYRAYKKQLDPTMRFAHKAGEKGFIDFAGVTIPWIERSTGEIFEAQIFVGVLGASNYTYVEALKDQGLGNWLGAHRRMFEFFGGCPSILVIDNLASGVTKAHRYEPEVNRTYQDFADHYHVAIVPARVRKPRDKEYVSYCILLRRLRDN